MIYIGEFFFITNQQEIDEGDRRHGEFNLIVETSHNEKAIDLFRERIVEFKEKSEFFEGDCSIFFIRLLEFEDFPKTKALMLNYKSTAGDPLMPFIGCTIPSDQTDSCRIYDWKDSRPQINGREENLFLEFKV
jgi:hypothetical protein